MSVPDPTLTMTKGGDARIVLDPATGLNRYFSAPRPSDVVAYASSTANDMSSAAFAHAAALLAEIEGALSPAEYRARLRALKGRIRAAYRVARDVEIVFAASGTDLEYVALACVAGRADAGIRNILLGADEVGRGCIHSAFGRYFAEATPLGIATSAGEEVPGLGGVEMIDVPVRDPDGQARSSGEITDRMRESIDDALAAKRHPLVHVVHGSKTGLALPSLEDVDALRAEHGDTISFVVDACQARITSAEIAAYLERDAIVFLTGSKFMGGPPFSGFALVPRIFVERAHPLPEGFPTLFRRAEWPEGWPGSELLPDTANLGLLLRLEASIFELERFQALGPEDLACVVDAFDAAVEAEIVAALGVRRVAGALSASVETRTLATLDLTPLGGASFEDAQGWHRAMIAHGVRIGQPVQCVRLPDGRWGATLRIALSMPLVVERVGLSDEGLRRAFTTDMAAVRAALTACMN